MQEFWQDKKVFVTGHTGFKGAWLCMILKNLGAQVTGYSLPPPTEPSLFDILGIKNMIDVHREGNVCDRKELSEALQQANPDIILHLAAQSLVRESYLSPIETFDTNVTGTLNVLQAARGLSGLKSVLIVTTDKCYRNDDAGALFTETDPLGGKDPYSASKACAEIVTQSYAESFFKDTDVTVSSARAGNVIGGGDWAADRLIPDVVRAIGANTPVSIRNPQSTRPWQHVLEPLFGYLMLAQSMFEDKGAFSGGWNFGPMESGIQSVGDVLDRLAQTLDFKLQKDDAVHPMEAKTLGLSIEKARSQLGWRPKLSLNEAVDWTGQWYQSYLNGQDLHEITLRQINHYKEWV